jgi:hypothetical protein
VSVMSEREAKGNDENRTRIHGHDEKQIGELADFVRYRSGGRVGGNCHPRFHASVVDGVDEGDGIRCIAVKSERMVSGMIGAED